MPRMQESLEDLLSRWAPRRAHRGADWLCFLHVTIGVPSPTPLEEYHPPSSWCRDRADGHLSVLDAVTLMRDVALGVEQLSLAGILWIDGKPENVLVDRKPDGHLMVKVSGRGRGGRQGVRLGGRSCRESAPSGVGGRRGSQAGFTATAFTPTPPSLRAISNPVCILPPPHSLQTLD